MYRAVVMNGILHGDSLGCFLSGSLWESRWGIFMDLSRVLSRWLPRLLSMGSLGSIRVGSLWCSPGAFQGAL